MKKYGQWNGETILVIVKYYECETILQAKIANNVQNIRNAINVDLVLFCYTMVCTFE